MSEGFEPPKELLIEDLYKVLNATGTFDGVANGINMNVAREVKTGCIAIDRVCQPAIWYYNVDETDNRLNDPSVPRSSIINVHYFENNENDFKNCVKLKFD